MRCFFVSDLHGHERRYLILFDAMRAERPDAVFLGGDLLPAGRRSANGSFPDVSDFINEFLLPHLSAVRREIGAEYPAVFLIPGNDDSRVYEPALIHPPDPALWTYTHEQWHTLKGFEVLGYAYVPPTPFRCKDWERYDVSRYIDPGCIAPEEGMLSVPRDPHELRYRTIEQDLRELTNERDLSRAILLLHTPPYDTALDRADLDGRMIDHVPLDVHVGSIAVRKFILERRPRLTLHGHIHESVSITGAWKEQLGATWCYSAAHKGRELALVRFDPDEPERATRELL